MTEFEVQWVEEPPPASGRQREYAMFAQALRDNPGRWAILPGPPRSGISSQVQQGKYAAFRPAGAFEAVSRRSLDDNKPRTYVRFVGDPDPTELSKVNGAQQRRSERLGSMRPVR